VQAWDFVNNEANASSSERLSATCLIEQAPRRDFQTSANFIRGNIKPYVDEFSSFQNMRITPDTS